MSSQFLDEAFTVKNPNVIYFDDRIEAKYTYSSTQVDVETRTVYPQEDTYCFRTLSNVPKTGLLLVGWGGNNGSTITAGILANKLGLSWTTKEGKQTANYFGSLTQSSTVRLGLDNQGGSVYIPFSHMLPMVNPNDLRISGWDISGLDLAASMNRAQVLDYDLQRQLVPHMQGLKPLPSIYSADFIANNQSDRADNIISGSKQSQLERIRNDIRHFRKFEKLDKVIVLWTATTERLCAVKEGLNTTATELLDAIQRDEAEISPSTIFATASVLEGCSYINGSPQNTFVPGLIQLAEEKGVFVVGDDFKSGQTKMKSVLVDYLVCAGLRPSSIVSYNHLGNNDGRNLSAPEQFRSKEVSKSNVVDDMVQSNRLLYKKGETPDHCVVIKYVPYVGDSKRAMDEYTSEIFLGGKNTIVMHNTCEDSLLAAPIMLDLVLLCELCERITIKRAVEPESAYTRFHPVLSLLSYLLKAPLVPPGMPVINALGAQRAALVNVFRACVGLAPENSMLLEHRLPALVQSCRRAQGDTATSVSSSSSAHESESGVTTVATVYTDVIEALKHKAKKVRR